MENFLGEWTTIVSVLGLFGITFTVEKLPIKFNPITMIKNFFTKDLEEDLKKVHQAIEKNQETIVKNHEKSEINHKESLKLAKELNKKIIETEEIINKRIAEKEQNLITKLNEKEIQDIQTVFQQASDLIDNNIKVSDVGYLHLSNLYDKYTKKLGGNSFVCETMEKIKESRK